jgi:hypothetical protein
MKNINFDEVKKALDLIQSLNQMDTDEVITEYLKYSKQNLTPTQLEFVLEEVGYSGLTNEFLLTSSMLPNLGINNIYSTVTGSPITPEISKTILTSVDNPTDFDYEVGMVIYYIPYGGMPRRERGTITKIFPDKLEILNETGKLVYVTKKIVVQAEVKTIIS